MKHNFDFKEQALQAYESALRAGVAGDDELESALFLRSIAAANLALLERAPHKTNHGS